MALNKINIARNNNIKTARIISYIYIYSKNYETYKYIITTRTIKATRTRIELPIYITA